MHGVATAHHPRHPRHPWHPTRPAPPLLPPLIMLCSLACCRRLRSLSFHSYESSCQPSSSSSSSAHSSSSFRRLNFPLWRCEHACGQEGANGDKKQQQGRSRPARPRRNMWGANSTSKPNKRFRDATQAQFHKFDTHTPTPSLSLPTLPWMGAGEKRGDGRRPDFCWGELHDYASNAMHFAECEIGGPAPALQLCPLGWGWGGGAEAFCLPQHGSSAIHQIIRHKKAESWLSPCRALFFTLTLAE